MTKISVKKLVIESLYEGIPVIHEEAVGFYKQNCMICFNLNGHKSGVKLHVFRTETEDIFEVNWTREVTKQLIKAYQDTNKATDFAACAIALLLVRELTEYTAIEQSCIGTTIDYYLTNKNDNDDLIFNNTARLEVSGILSENKKNTVERRIKQKTQRLNPETSLSDIIIVVEFSKPWSKMVEI